MKRKLLLAMVSVLAVLLCAMGLSACNEGGRSGADGTYYLYMDGSPDKTQYITLDGGSWTDESGDGGECEVSGDSVVLYAELLGEKEEFATGTVRDGVLVLNILGIPLVYCKDGVTPPAGELPQEKYTVTYDANGGAFENDETTFSQTEIPSGALLTAPASPSRDGYTFSGWAKNRNGSDLWMFDSDRVNKNVTLYAVWTQESGIIVSVDGASIDGTDIFMLTEPSLDSVSLSSKVVCSEGSTWKLYYDKLGQVEIPTKIAAGQSGVLEDGNNTFYIVVTSDDGTQVNTYRLIIHRSYSVSVSYYDGGDLIKTDSVYTGNEYTADYVPQIKGYTFNGWKTADGTAFRSATVMGAFSLFADKTANEYRAELDVNGGEPISQTEYTVTFGSHYSFPVPVREGYRFIGWYDGGTKLTDEEGQSVYAWSYALNMTLLAKWEAIVHTVTLNRTDEAAGTVTGGGEYDYGSAVTVRAYTQPGYTWLGWYDENGEFFTQDTAFTFTIESDVTYTAKWTYYTLNVKAGNSQAGTVTGYTDRKVTVGEQVTLSAESNDGYSFLGWYKGDTLATQEFSFTFEMPAENLSYTARWVKCPVTVGSANTAIGSARIEPGSVMGGEITIVAEANKLGYVFLGWYVNYIKVSDEIRYTFPLTDESVRYIAEWEIADEMKLFEFESGSTYCTITGVIEDNLDVAYLTIPDCVTGIAANAFTRDAMYSVVSVTIPETVTSVARYAFRCDAPLVICCEAAKRPSGWDVSWESNSVGDPAAVIWDCNNSSLAKDGCYYTEIGGLRYRLNADGTATVYRQAETISGEVVIPSSVSFGGKEYAVSEIYGADIYVGAFNNCKSLTKIVLPDGMTKIGGIAFKNCTALSEITFSDTITEIGTMAFSGCSAVESVFVGNLAAWMKIAFGNPQSNPMGEGDNATLYVNDEAITELVIPEEVTKINRYAFIGCKQFTSVTVGDQVTEIGYSAFENCSTLTVARLGNGVTKIDKYAFAFCGKLADLVIGSAMTEIAQDAFYYCSGLERVFYVGTEAQWDVLAAASSNSRLPNDRVYYYSETQPSADGNYWHYDADGVTPVIWNKENA